MPRLSGGIALPCLSRLYGIIIKQSWQVVIKQIICLNLIIEPEMVWPDPNLMFGEHENALYITRGRNKKKVSIKKCWSRYENKYRKKSFCHNTPLIMHLSPVSWWELTKLTNSDNLFIYKHCINCSSHRFIMISIYNYFSRSYIYPWMDP